MTEADNSELCRLCAELEKLHRTSLPVSQQEALKKAAIALSTAFMHGLRGEVENHYDRLDEPLTDDARQRMKTIGIDPDAP